MVTSFSPRGARNRAPRYLRAKLTPLPPLPSLARSEIPIAIRDTIFNSSFPSRPERSGKFERGNSCRYRTRTVESPSVLDRAYYREFLLSIVCVNYRESSGKNEPAEPSVRSLLLLVMLGNLLFDSIH